MVHECEARCSPVEVHKIKAHAEASHILAGTIRPEDVLGNYLADAMAGVAAEANEVSASERNNMHEVDEKAEQVLSRLMLLCGEAAAMKDPERKRTVGLKGTAAGASAARHTIPFKLEVLRKLGHNLVRGRNSYVCSLCGGGGGPIGKLVRWSKSGRGSGRPSVPSGESGSGSQSGFLHVPVAPPPPPTKFHSSHPIQSTRGIWWCKRCGSFCVDKS